MGCRLNQAESESIAEGFARAGHEVLEGGLEAELHVVNSCTVTGMAEQKARRLIRAIAKASPGARIIVTGCYATMDAAAVRALGEGVEAIPGGRKAELLAMAGASAAADDPFAFAPPVAGGRSRASLKVQDGCDNRCAYCRVWMARGPARSIDPALALERLRGLEAAGRAEATLTGVNLSQYAAGGLDFPGLVSFLLAGTSRVRLRISSYEPDRVDPGFLRIAAEGRVRPFFHLAVQSLSGTVLSAMGRRGPPERVLEAVAALRSAREDPFVSCDLIAGFPGEGEAEAAETLARAEEAGFSAIHAFAFSPRPGTRAAEMRPRPPESVAKARVAALASLSARLREAYARRWLGRELEAVAEEGGMLTAENFLKLRAEGAPAPGSLVRCLVSETFPRGGLGGADGSASIVGMI